MPPITGPVESSNLLKELREYQLQTFDKASTYTKVILGLGYASFFTAWSGGKVNLRPLEVMSSAMLVSFSLVLFIGFEIYETYFVSRQNVSLMRAVHLPDPDVFGAIADLKAAQAKRVKTYICIWTAMYWPITISGALGALILIAAFGRAVWRLWK